ncbi:MAG TPA: GH32 C-terminal domain-containing protein [Catalimonadaceae bacterium]|nr:GH32 C-terminal domain-containing protein [Catalimonadaceae bacterium]
MKYTAFFFVFWIVQIVQAQQLYKEKYRPQFHVSPSRGFMGDPCGTLKFRGTYHLHWWGHARSNDLVYWTELNTNALQGTPGGFGNWTGSAVMDLHNTSGFGVSPDNPPMVAVYTLHENATGIQRQAISTSFNYGSFQYYSGNPVINSSLKDFRDPQVFWHKPTNRWVMVITKPVDKAVEIYSSPNLKDWTYESVFKGRGAEKELWEVPDLFPLPLNGDTTNEKWVMACGMGPNRMQYWVGSFDGRTFTLDTEDNLLTGKYFGGDVIADFEQAGYGNWIVSGTAFGSGPTLNGTLPDQQSVKGYSGHQCVNSFHNGDNTTGKMTSPEFTITKRNINLLIGGGTGANLTVKLIVNGVAVATIANTSETETMRWRGVNVTNWIGQMAKIEITDNATGGWGHILVDHIVQSDVLFDTRIENANWADWGIDFYAAKSFNNYDTADTDKRRIWLGWVGNWTYARNVPTQGWQGCESLPRELMLSSSGEGFRLKQKPVTEFAKLRKEEYKLNNLQFVGTYPIEAFKPTWNVYEMQVSFKVTRKNQIFGLNLAEGTGQKITISYDVNTSNLSVSRPTDKFTFSYIRESKAPLPVPADSIIKLHIYLDQSSIEVFANDYETALTSLTFLDQINTGISLFSNNGNVLVPEFKVWPLKSIWGVLPPVAPDPPDTTTPIDTTHQPVVKKKILYPNPLMAGDSLNYYLLDSAQSIVLYDKIGRKISEFKRTENGKIKIPRELKAGIYFLRLQTSKEKITKRLIVRQRE